MPVIVFATGGTTANARTVEHLWENYQFVISSAVQSLRPLFIDLKVHAVANCLTAGNLWGGFIFAHEICRVLGVKYYPFASVVEHETLCHTIYKGNIDTIICMPNFAERLMTEGRKAQLSSIRNIFYLGEMFPESLIEKIQQLLPGVCIKPLAYSAQETGPVGFQCSHLSGSRYHIYDHIDLRCSPINGELNVTVKYPSQSNLLDHNTGDVGTVERNVFCPCGHTGDILHLHGRIPTYRNILGTSISIYDFSEVLSENSDHPISDNDLQLVEVDYADQGLGLILMMSQKNDISPNTIAEKLNSSLLIKKLIIDSKYFHVFIAEKKTFLKSGATGKIKPFIRTINRPSEEGLFCLKIK